MDRDGARARRRQEHLRRQRDDSLRRLSGHVRFVIRKVEQLIGEYEVTPSVGGGGARV